MSNPEVFVSYERSGNLDSANSHKWVTVVNPTNKRMLLQACDNCGVVKSENSVMNKCAKPANQNLISGAMNGDLEMVS